MDLLYNSIGTIAMARNLHSQEIWRKSLFLSRLFEKVTL